MLMAHAQICLGVLVKVIGGLRNEIDMDDEELSNEFLILLVGGWRPTWLIIYGISLLEPPMQCFSIRAIFYYFLLIVNWLQNKWFFVVVVGVGRLRNS